MIERTIQAFREIFPQDSKENLSIFINPCDSCRDVKDRLEKFFETGDSKLLEQFEGKFGAPQFYSERCNAASKYHLHLYKSIKREDQGIMLTLVGNRVYAEEHRRGKVKRPLNVLELGECAVEEILMQASDLARFPEEHRRRPSKTAAFLGICATST